MSAEGFWPGEAPAGEEENVDEQEPAVAAATDWPQPHEQEADQCQPDAGDDHDRQPPRQPRVAVAHLTERRVRELGLIQVARLTNILEHLGHEGYCRVVMLHHPVRRQDAGPTAMLLDSHRLLTALRRSGEAMAPALAGFAVAALARAALAAAADRAAFNAGAAARSKYRPNSAPPRRSAVGAGGWLRSRRKWRFSRPSRRPGCGRSRFHGGSRTACLRSR